VIGRVATAVGAAVVSVVGVRAASRRAADRLLDGPRVGPGEATLGPRLDALGGEVVRFRSRDGLRLAGRWLPAEAGAPEAHTGEWTLDPHEAIVLLHGYSGSVAPDLVEYAPFLRRTASVLGLDFRGHGDSDPGPSTFGMLEVEDIAGALAWLGERGVQRVALFGTSMGAMAAISAVAILGDGSLAAADAEPDATRAAIDPPRPRIVAVVADSTAPEAETAVANRLPGPFRRFLAARAFDAAARRLGADPRDTEPIRVIGLVEPVPLLLIHGEQDTTVPLDAARRLAEAAGPSASLWTVPDAEHSAAHIVAGQDYERVATDHLRMAIRTARDHDLLDGKRDL
jgi:pimeloyl-ACP methyl ester carboxylesterase